MYEKISIFGWHTGAGPCLDLEGAFMYMKIYFENIQFMIGFKYLSASVERTMALMDECRIK